MKERIQKIITSKFGTMCDKFCNSAWYSVAFGLVCVVSHICRIPVVGATLVVVLLLPALLFCKNSFVLVPFALMCSFVMSQETNPDTGYYDGKIGYLVILCLLLVIAVAAFVFNLVCYGNWRKLFKRSYLTVSLIALTGVLWVSGLGSSTMTFVGFGLALAVAATMFVPYALVVNCGEYKGKETVKYVAYAVITAAFVIIIDYFEKYAANDFNMFYGSVKGFLQLGFVGPNTGAAIIALALPMTFYLVYSCKRGFLWMIAVVIETIAVVLTFSRASLVVVVPGVIIVSVALCFKQKTDKLGYWIAFGICAVGALTVCIVFRNVIIDELKTLFVGNITGSGRTTLWRIGFEAWTEHPIFGVGLGFLLTKGYWYYSFHCTPLTYLYCAGALGFVAYLYHRYKTVRLVFSAKLTPERVFAALSVAVILLNALLDIAMTSATHLLYYAILLALIECDVNSVKAQSRAACDHVGNNVVNSDNNEKISENNNIQVGK